MVFGKLFPGKKEKEPPSAVDEGGGAAATVKKGSAKQALTVNEFVARTKKSKEKGLEPTGPELVAYARYLGIDAIADADLMWIAEDALSAPLPSEWTEHHDSAECVFYFNVKTNSSSWTHPLEQIHRDTYKTIVAFRNSDKSPEEKGAEVDRLRRQCEEAERAAHKELQAWTEHTDDQGKTFYFNRDQKTSVWTDPRPAHCHSLYLQMKALRVLSKHCGQTPSALRPPEALAADLSKALGGGTGGRSKAQTQSSSEKGGAAVSDKSLAGFSSVPGGFGNAGSLATLGDHDFEGSNAPVEDKEHRRKRKKKHQKAAEWEEENFPQPGRESRDKEPEMAAVAPEKYRNNLVDLGRLPRQKGDDSWAQGPKGRGSLNRLSTPPGDGLSNVGRARVRGGIKLAPISGPEQAEVLC